MVAAFLVLAVEGVLLIRYYDRYYWSNAPSGNAASSAPAFERTVPERTAPERIVPERTAPRAPASMGDVPSEDDGAAFAHRATPENSRGDYTYLDDPNLNGDPDAVVLAAPTSARGGGGDYDHNVGVWFEPQAQKWAIFNQDLAPVPDGATFRVVIPAEPERFVHRATDENTSEDGTYLDHPLVNGKPDAAPSVTQNWNPGGGNGVYNDHAVDARYDADREAWEVFNRDGSALPEGASFNVGVS